MPQGSNQPSEWFGRSIPLLGRGAIGFWFTRIEREPVGTDCRWTFPEVPDGDYVARLVRPDGSGGSQEAQVTGATPQTIEIPAPTVAVSGVVTLDGVPHGAEIRIRDQSWRGPTVTVTADADGRYAAMLDRPGTYVMSVLAQSPRAAGGRVVVPHEGLNQLDIPLTTPTGPSHELGLASLTVPEGALPDGCRLQPDVPSIPVSAPPPDGRVSVVNPNPESLSHNPWIGFDRHVLIGLLWTAPFPDGPPPTARQMRAMQSESLLHVREGYRAVYDSAEGSAIEVRAVRFDDTREMPVTLATPSQPDRGFADQFAIGRIFVEIAAPSETACSRAIDATLRALK